MTAKKLFAIIFLSIEGQWRPGVKLGAFLFYGVTEMYKISVEKQGLYDPRYEHDACGMGFVVNVDGKKSREIIDDALTILENLDHRGAKGADENTGDGAGIMVQIPHTFFKRDCAVLGFDLPEPGFYGVGMIFAHRYDDFRREQIAQFEAIVAEQGQKVLGWREVPVDKTVIGKAALAVLPRFIQVFIAADETIKNAADFERRLYIIRKQAEKRIVPDSREIGSNFYLLSLSCQTIVYKGMLTAPQLRHFYLDLSDLDFTSAIALVHSRFSTNTFPSWERAHPNRLTVHNGEINTIRGNVNWMRARQKRLKSALFDELSQVYPIIDETGSDSSMFDNCLEFLYLTGRSLPHAVMMLIPEPWEKNPLMSAEKQAFYAYHQCLMEPWDGPAAIGFTDGKQVGAVLDRNGLRPARYYVTKQGKLIMASEVGVLSIREADIVHKGRLEPGKMLLIDTEQKRIIPDEEIKDQVASALPYGKWVKEKVQSLEQLLDTASKQDTVSTLPSSAPLDAETLLRLQKMFGYTQEDLYKTILPLALNGEDPLGSMGMDVPLAVLSDKPQLLFMYFKQLFAQVTNPPIDGIREALVTSSTLVLGDTGRLLDEAAQEATQNVEAPSPLQSCVVLPHPLLDAEGFAALTQAADSPFKIATLSTLYDVNGGEAAMERSLEKLFRKAEQAIADTCNLIVLSDRGADRSKAALPSLLAVSALHHHLIRQEVRTNIGIVLESAEPREVHHFCTLVGYGVTAVYPYLALQSVADLQAKALIPGQTVKEAQAHYIKGIVKGMMKVISKMGISTMRSYQAAQIFEAVGLQQKFVDKYFTSTASRLQGIGMREIAEDYASQHRSAFPETDLHYDSLDSGGVFQCVHEGESHLYRPETVYLLQRAVREGDYQLYKDFAAKISAEAEMNLRSLLDFDYSSAKAVPIEEVEPVSSIVKRFKTGAMSYGSISRAAHETLAIAMNRLGGRSNTGEGGEDPQRFKLLDNGDSKMSAIKQVASGRFGVTIDYLLHANEIQIKMAQGAKPGEGGQLPGSKVYPQIGETRHSTPGVGLISPPPHHDIYSIEDLAELILDLKTANPAARISVKLVSEVGVGTIAAGVAKGKADVILISGYEGGTGAAPRTSIKNAGLPWELGLAEAHQTLILNGLRDRVALETDGKLLCGRDVVIAALLGADEFGFATTPLIALGCVMMRVCDLNTCPVGVATHDERLTSLFQGKPEHVVNLMQFIAQDMREIMAKLGFRTVDEMVGRADRLRPQNLPQRRKALKLDLSPLLYQPYLDSAKQRYHSSTQDHQLERSLDAKKLLRMCKPALEEGKPVVAKLAIRNTDRVVGTGLGSAVCKKYGAQGLPEDTIQLSFEGSAGQSFGAFVPQGMRLSLEGDANDYIGKGLSGGKIIVYPSRDSELKAEENILIGNVAFYGATSGSAYINGVAGERFCVRNSGVEAVVEGVGDHGCEYMTGGRVLVLGKVGRNFAAGMSGGIAYVLDLQPELCNLGADELSQVAADSDDLQWIKDKISTHWALTGSQQAERILEDWPAYAGRFTKVYPREYRLMQEEISRALSSGLDRTAAVNFAFKQLLLTRDVKH